LKEFHDITEQYLNYLRGVRNLSEKTTAAYKQDLHKLGRFLEERELKADALKPADVRLFLAELEKQKLASSSVNRIISAIKGFYSFAVTYELTGRNPFDRIRSFKRERHLPSVLTRQEVRMLLNAPKDDFLGKRDAALLHIFYSTGSRLSEVTAMNEEDVHVGNGFILVHGKGNKDRFVYLTKPAASVLRQYLEFKHRRFAPDENSELSGDGRTVVHPLIISSRGRRITAQGVHHIFRKYTDSLDLPKHVTPHTLRHTFATHILDNDAGIRAVQELLGHENISTTQIYSHVGIERLRRVYEQTHPHGRRKT